MRTVAVVTSSRADWSSSRVVARAIDDDPELQLRLLVTGQHLAPDFGNTVDDVEADGFAPEERIPGFAGATAEGAARSVALVAEGLAASFARERPDLVLVVGDRLELLGVAAAALPFLIPVAHVSGGDATGGAIDDVVRHALTKLAHLHFVALEEHAERLVAMGEEKSRITVSGDPALDAVAGPWPPLEELAPELGVEPRRPVVAVGFHPSTLGGGSPADETEALLAALGSVDGTFVFTYPGADAGAAAVIERIEAFAAQQPNAVVHASLGQQRYYALLAVVDALVGNSSSGIWESASFRLPVVNVGDRQRGRLRPANVLDAPAEAEAIRAALARALAPSFRAELDGLVNPYGDGHAAERIVRVLREVDLGERLLAKWDGGTG